MKKFLAYAVIVASLASVMLSNAQGVTSQYNSSLDAKIESFTK